ncbi:MAG: agmatinase [Firmicutes bacterium]|nr:agmatinase [Bacillota bacterium]
MMAPLCLDLEQLDADVAVLGVPYDMGSAVRSGSRFGPRGVRSASTLNNGYCYEGWYDPVRDTTFMGPQWKIVDCGDIDVMHTYHEQTFKTCETAVRKILDKGAIPFVIGGDHAITIPVLRAFDRYADVCVIQFDSHMDFTYAPAGIWEGQGSPMRRASEMAHVGKMMQIGIRGIGSSKPSDFADARAYGSKILTPRDFRELGIPGVCQQIPDAKYYYITFDIDCLDMSIANGCGSPQAGGLYYEEVVPIIEAVSAKGEVVGFDMVEVAPPYDWHEMTAHYAAQIMVDAMSFILKDKERRQSQSK